MGVVPNHQKHLLQNTEPSTARKTPFLIILLLGFVVIGALKWFLRAKRLLVQKSKPRIPTENQTRKSQQKNKQKQNADCLSRKENAAYNSQAHIPTPLQDHLTKLYGSIPYVSTWERSRPSDDILPYADWHYRHIGWKLVEACGLAHGFEDVWSRNIKRAKDIAEAYVKLHWVIIDYHEQQSILRPRLEGWIQDILSNKIAREVNGEFRIMGFNDIPITGKGYLQDLRQFRREMKQREVYWKQRLLGKRIVMSLDLNVKQVVIYEELPTSVENFVVYAQNLGPPSDGNFRKERVGVFLDEEDVVTKVWVG